MLSTNESVPTNEVERWPYDLKHWSHVCSSIGALQTFSVIPTLPGDSFEINFKGQFKFSPFVRSLAQDAVLDLFAFWVPHRHIYSNWVDWLKGGYDEGVTLGTKSISAATPVHCVGQRLISGDTVPTWITKGYMDIWNRYFKHPSSADLSDDYLLSTALEERMYGVACCHIKSIWNTGMPDGITTADRDYTVSGGVVDLPDFALQQARLKSELDRDWFSIRYKDLLENTWGGSAEINADERPDLIMRSTQFISGWDVESTDSAGVGSYTGRGAGVGELFIPRRFFPEHGTIWIMGLLRFPPVASTELHYSVTHPEPTYQNFAGDPEVLANSEPIEVTTADFFSDGSSTVLNRIPYGQWHRYQPSYVHQNFSDLTGHPFLANAPASTSEGLYVDYLMYNPLFANINLRHWHANCYIETNAWRCVPPPKASIYAGTRK